MNGADYSFLVRLLLVVRLSIHRCWTCNQLSQALFDEFCCDIILTYYCFIRFELVDDILNCIKLKRLILSVLCWNLRSHCMYSVDLIFRVYILHVIQSPFNHLTSFRQKLPVLPVSLLQHYRPCCVFLLRYRCARWWQNFTSFSVFLSRSPKQARKNCFQLACVVADLNLWTFTSWILFNTYISTT